jgi:hypothetical protein
MMKAPEFHYFFLKKRPFIYNKTTDHFLTSLSLVAKENQESLSQQQHQHRCRHWWSIVHLLVGLLVDVLGHVEWVTSSVAPSV